MRTEPRLPSNKIGLFVWIGLVTFSYFSGVGLGRAQDIASIRSGVAAKICPASEYARITYEDRSCGWSAQKACDDQYRAPTEAWRQCYAKMDECRKQADADNEVISEANIVYRACHRSKPNSGQGSTQSDLESRLSAQREKAAKADGISAQQDQEFENAVRSTQQIYQRKATERAEQEAKERATRAQDRRLDQCSNRGSEYQVAIISACNGESYCIGGAADRASAYIKQCIDQVYAGTTPSPPPALNSQNDSQQNNSDCPPGYYKNGMYCVANGNH